MSKFKIGVIQIDVGNNRAENLKKLDAFIDEAAAERVQMVTMPEAVAFFGSGEENFADAEPLKSSAVAHFFADKAKQHKIWVHTGSFYTKEQGEKKIHNTSLVINPKGEIVARYDKIHMFDVDLAGGLSFKESDGVIPGDHAVVADTEFCKIGMAVCYDMRFPELFRVEAVAGAKVLFNPALYMMFTGKDHWMPIMRARAIENQCWLVAPDQVGTKVTGAKAYGRSVVIDPWGNVVAMASDREEVIYATIDPDYADAIRAQLPSLSNRRPDAYHL